MQLPTSLNVNRFRIEPGNCTYRRNVVRHSPYRLDFQLNPQDNDSTNLTVSRYSILRLKLSHYNYQIIIYLFKSSTNLDRKLLC
jgi:hypothetical protein